jgi:sugar phosphate isomerase/epimerase
MGIVEWTELMKILKNGGYTGSMVIEHEDPLYEGEKRNEGLALGLQNLREELKEAG